MSAIGTLGTTARIALGGVRIVAGTTGLLAPAMIISRFGDSNPSANPAAIYGLRLFGLQQQHPVTRLGQVGRDRPTPGTGADDDVVEGVGIGRKGIGRKGHDRLLRAAR